MGTWKNSSNMKTKPAPPCSLRWWWYPPGAKSDLLACLEDVSQPRSEAPLTSCIVLDGAVIVQMLKPDTAKSFNEYAHEVFTPHILSKFQQTTRLDLLWDRYLPHSFKGTTRAKRGKGLRRRVLSRASIPGNWASFLRVDDNKTELFSFLSGALLHSFQLAEMQWSSRIEMLS